MQQLRRERARSLVGVTDQPAVAPLRVGAVVVLRERGHVLEGDLPVEQLRREWARALVRVVAHCADDGVGGAGGV